MAALYWLRSDLRINDNPVLNAFCKNETHGAFIWAPTASFIRAQDHRLTFIKSSLVAYNSILKEHGHKLLIAKNSFVETLRLLLGQMTITKIYYSREFAFEELSEENEVRELAEQHKIEIIEIDQNTLVNEQDLPFELSSMPLVFTSFRKKIEKNLHIIEPYNFVNIWPAPLKIEESELNLFESVELNKKTVHSEITSLGFSQFMKAGEKEALNHLHNYIWQTESISSYKETRNSMISWNDSSKLSLWINSGALSPRTVYQEIKEFEAKRIENESTYWLFFELLWRDYFKFLSRKTGIKIFQLQGLSLEKPKFIKRNKPLFNLWCEGNTGDDFVDANMRELNQTGWMSNRGRQNVASFLVHQLHLPWTWGAAYFENKLIDYDPDLNWGNWLYISGAGTDPRSRVFNTQKQAEMYDANSSYRNKWLR